LELRNSRRSPEVLKHVVELGGNAHSYKEASQVLQRQTAIEIGNKETQRLTEQVGTEWAAARDEQVEQFKQGTLPRLHSQPHQAASVMVDGAYVQTRAAEARPGVQGQCWSEVKCASLATLASHASAVDPMPEPPSKFLNPERVKKIVAEVSERHVAATTAPQRAVQAQPQPKRKRRKGLRQRIVRLVTTFVATMQNAAAFGYMVAAEAYLRGLDLAKYKGFVCDGMPYNWTIYETHFRPLGFIPILDFLHLLTYLYTAAQALEAGRAWRAWQTYEQWLYWAWRGERQRLLAALQTASGKVGLPPPGAPENDRRAIVARAATYVANNYDRIDYPRYRKLGLPYSSAPVESAVKQFCRRVKGSEKFWVEGGAEATLQVRAAHLSQDDRVERLWARPVETHAYGTNWRDIAA